MVENNSNQKSLFEQILEELFLSIENKEEFDSQTILFLKKLADNKQLHSVEEVTKAIIGNQEEKNETY